MDGKLKQKRNIVSEDDEDDVDEQEENTDRYHKEMILLNEHPLNQFTTEKIIQKTISADRPYRKRNEIPIRHIKKQTF